MGGQNTPTPPNQGQSYEQGIQAYLKYLPQLEQQEQQARLQYDPASIAENQALQQIYGPNQYNQQLQALNQIDPTGQATRQNLGYLVNKNLANPQNSASYDTLGQSYLNSLQHPQNQQAYSALGSTAYQNLLHPQNQGEYDALGRSTTAGLANPEGNDVYKALQSGVLGDLNSGYNIPAGLLRETQQNLRGAQAARGNVLGDAPANAEALYTGQAANTLYQQHQTAAENFLNTTSPTAKAQQAASSYLSLLSPQQQAQQSLTQYLGLTSPTQQGQQGLSSYLNLVSPQQRSLDNAGQFLGLSTPEQQISLINPVSPDRTSSYVNPNAGYQGQQFAQQNYQNLLAGQQIAGGSPWTRALSGSATGAAEGSAAGGSDAGGWGALAGGVIGYLSDRRVKTDITKVGVSPRGYNIYTFRYQWKNGMPSRLYRGVMADEVLKIRPSAVGETDDGFLCVDYAQTDVRFEEVM